MEKDEIREGLMAILDGVGKKYEKELEEKYNDIGLEFLEHMKIVVGKTTNPVGILTEYNNKAFSVSYGVQNKMWAILMMMLKDVDFSSLTKQNKFFIDRIRSLELRGLIRNYIEVNEGWPLSGDKESFILKRIAKGIVENRDDIDFESSYADAGRPDMDKEGKRPYWCPETLSNTKELYELLWAHAVAERSFLKKEVLQKLKEDQDARQNQDT
jgi:hypothetical protein